MNPGDLVAVAISSDFGKPRPALVTALLMSNAIDWIDRNLYPSFADSWDIALFRQVVLDHLEPSHVLLDVGAGAGIQHQMDFKDRAKLVCGVDPDPRVSSNPFLHDGRIASAEQIPWPDNTFDIVVSNNVMEHLYDPETVFVEIYRVLKPSGIFLFKTPNSWHYATLISRCTPHRFHEWFNRKRGRATDDIFPTCYKANSSRSIRRYCRSAGFTLRNIRYYEGRPEYLRFSVPSYLVGCLYERIVNLTWLSMFRVVIVGVIQK